MIDEGIRGNSSIAFGLPPISGVLQSRTPRDSRKIPQEDKSSPYYSSNNRQRLVGQVSSRGRGSGFVPGSIGAKLFRISERARVQQTRSRFFSYIGLLFSTPPPFRRGIRVRNGKRRGNVRTFFLPSALFPLYAARITSILGLALYALFFENVRIYENLVSSRVVLPKFPPPTRLRKGEKRKNDRGIIVIRVTINHFHHFQSSVRSLLEHSFGC